MASDNPAIRIAQLRASRGLTQTQLAAALAVSHVTLNRWERGHTAPSAANLETIARLGRAEGAAPIVAHPEAPAPLTAFIGRSRDLAALSATLTAQRLVVITGTGGCGKTRVALELLRDAKPDGGRVTFVELATVTDPALLISSIAATLAVRETQRSTLDGVLQSFREQKTLLVLDNCEHLADAVASFVEDALRACGSLRVLATSRVPLGIPGETAWPLSPLELPPESPATSERAILESDAVRLFIARASERDPAFTPVPHASALGDVCHALDGLPLAIEMAATLATTLSPAEIASRLRAQLDVLPARETAYPPHHRSLRAAVLWSIDLLEPADRVLFARLSAFSGEFDLDSVTAICEWGRVPDAPAGLARLVHASLIASVHRGTALRFRMLGTVRAFAAELANASDESDELGNRHAAFYWVLVQQAERGAAREQQIASLERIRRVQPDLRDALEWLSGRDATTFGQMALKLWRFWFTSGNLAEGRAWYERVIASHAVDELMRCRARNRAGAIAHQQGDFDAARDLFLAALPVARDVHYRSAEMGALAGLGMVAFERGEFGQAGEMLTEAGDIARELAMGWHIRVYRSYAGCAAALIGDLERARSFLDDGEAARAFASDPQSLGIHWHALGLVAFLEGDHEMARECYAEATTAFDDVGYGFGQAICLDAFGHLELREGNLGAARDAFIRALRLRTDLGLRHGIIAMVVALGTVCVALGDFTGFALLHGAREGLASEHDATSIDVLGHDIDDERAVRVALGASRYASLRRRGRALSIDDVIELAERLATHLPAGRAATAPGLSAREREVLALLVGGRTNRQIAAQLMLSARTVETHVQSLYRRLGVHGRAEAAAVAVREALI
jgi:non-specific serine/threonine protein kinase